jgi:hypothetical protein
MPTDSPRLSVSLRLSGALARPWRITVDPVEGRPDLQPELPWSEMRPGNQVVFGAGNVYEVERIAVLKDEPRAAVLAR